jgi:hypothetical protein
MSKIEITEDVIKKMEEMESGLYQDFETLTIQETPQEPHKDTPSIPQDIKVFLTDIPEHNIGWIKLNKEILPSKGLFYDKSLVIEITPANVKHIKNFSSLTEDDSYKINERINAILSSCVKLSNGKRRYTPKDILEIDKFWLVLAIRDLTFYKIPNKLINPSSCPKCNSSANIEIFSYNSTFFNFDDNLMQFYDYDENCFILDIENTNEVLKLKPPTISISTKMENYYNEVGKSKNIDREFLNEIQYLDLDWHNMDYRKVDDIIVESFGWSLHKTTLLKKFVNDFKNQIKMNSIGTCQSCGAEGVSTKFYFRGGVLSIFLIQDIYSYVRKRDV